MARSKVLSSGQIAKHRGQARRIRTPTTRVIELGLQQPPRRKGDEGGRGEEKRRLCKKEWQREFKGKSIENSKKESSEKVGNWARACSA